MASPLGLWARQANFLTSALALVLALPGLALAQDEPGATAEVQIVDTTTPGAAHKPGRLRAAKVPVGALAQEVLDVIPGGPGYIAVGGGSNTGLDLKALIWVSDDGARWQSVPLFGDAGKGLIHAVSPVPGGGFVAVGHEFMPADAPPETITKAVVLRSDEGIIWERVPAHESFVGSMMYDVTATTDGLVAIGCQAGFHCDVGRAWSSADGHEWELASEFDMAPFAVGNMDGVLVAGGTDDAVDLNGGRAVIGRSTDGTSWGLSDPMSEPRSQFHDITVHDGALLAAGFYAPRDGGRTEAGLFRSADGETWDRIESGKFKNVTPTSVSSAGDLLLIGGFSYDRDKGASTPVLLWSSDLETFRKAKVPKGIGTDGLAIQGGGASDSMAFVTGRDDAYMPAIWFSNIK